MQLDGDNSTISVKVFILSHYFSLICMSPVSRLSLCSWQYTYMPHSHPRLSSGDVSWACSWQYTCQPSWWTSWGTPPCSSSLSSLRLRFVILQETRNYFDFILTFLQVSVNLTVMLVLTTMFVRWIVTIFIRIENIISDYLSPGVSYVVFFLSV